MIDLHSHILPGVDDGAKTLDDSLAMARMAAEDGIEVMACTPHFMPGLYDNEAADICARVDWLNQCLLDADIPLTLVAGADAHIRPDFIEGLRQGAILTLHSSHYVLVEPPHNVIPPRLDELLFNISMAGFVPILTHPERLKWIESSYDQMVAYSHAGAWMQITAGSLTGRFGKRPQYWSQRMLAEGLVDILATDAHNISSRPPLLAEAAALAAKELGNEEATNLVLTRPECVLMNVDPSQAPPRLKTAEPKVQTPGFWQRLLGART